MRIAIIVPFYPFPPSVGGVKTIAIEVAKELRRLGHEVIIVTSPVDNVTRNIVTKEYIEMKDNIMVVNLPPGFMRIGDIKGLIGQRSLRYLNEILHTINADVIHIHNIHPYIYQVLRYVKKSLKYRNVSKPVVVIEPHHPAVSLYSPLLKHLLLPISVQWIKSNIRFINRIIAHTFMELKWWKHRGIGKVSLIRFPVVRDELFNYNPRKVEVCHMNALTFIGRVVPVKRIEVLLYALAIIRQKIPDIKLFIIGPANEQYKRKLENIIVKLGLLNNVNFVGPLYGYEKYDYIACSKAVVLPSKREYTPNVVIEAQALGIPVIATNVGALNELVIDGRTGFLVNVDDVAGLAKTILRLLINEKLWYEVSLAAKIHAKKFSLSNSVSKLLKVYKGES